MTGYIPERKFETIDIENKQIPIITPNQNYKHGVIYFLLFVVCVCLLLYLK
jgi:hypothetical protein